MVHDLEQVLQLYVDAQVQIKPDTITEYRGTVNWLRRALERPASTDDLNDATITRFLKTVASKRSMATAGKHRRQVMLLWSFAWRKGWAVEPPRDVPTIRIPRRRPQAWTPEEVARILEACHEARPIPGWGPLRWIALALSIYDCGERISPLLLIPESAFEPNRRLLSVAAEYRKRGVEDQVYRLHDQTVEAISRSLEPGQDRLFPWPLHRRSLWPAWKRILRTAGLPCTSRDLFHKLRRTNYTQVFIACGRETARRNAGHSRDLTHLYLDETQLPGNPICDAIRRPAV